MHCWGGVSISLSVLSVTNRNAVVPPGLFFSPPLCLQNNSCQDCFAALLLCFMLSKTTAELIQHFPRLEQHGKSGLIG